MYIQLSDEGILTNTAVNSVNFNPIAEVAICFIEVDGKILLLKNVNKKIENHTWGVPGGKLEPSETPIQALLRELTEETGLQIEQQEITFKHTIYARLVPVDFTLHVFKTKLSGQISQYYIRINLSEHSEYIWVTPQDAFKLNLIKRETEIIELLYPTGKF